MAWFIDYTRTRDICPVLNCPAAMANSQDREMDIEKLRQLIQGKIYLDQESRQDVATDFGRILVKTPKALVAPASFDDVAAVLATASRKGWPVATRGASHSQSGQSLSQDGVLLDLSPLNEIGAVEGETVRVQAGVLWRDLVAFTSERGLLPPVLTNNLNVTVGGTLSMAGIGVSSHRHGTQAHQVLELEVVTGEGHRVRCSPEENSELFFCTLCGLGQFSVIVSARLRLRPVAPKVRTYYLLYDDLGALMGDQKHLLSQQRFDYIESWASPCVQGLRRMGGVRVPFAEWFFPMQLTVEFGEEEPREEELLKGLNFYRKLQVEDSSVLEFAHRLEPVFDLWRQSGAWGMCHPWMETILPWDQAPGYIAGVLANFPPQLLAGGHVLIWPCRFRGDVLPLFRHPPGEFILGFGILPAVPRQMLPLARQLLKTASDLSMRVGGKRYLSGWVEFTPEQWMSHFGEVWEDLQRWKEFYDPAGVMNPGFIPYPDRPESRT